MAIAALIVAALWYSLFILLHAQTAQSFLAPRESQPRSFSKMPRRSRTSGMSTTTTTMPASLLMQSPTAPSRRRAAATYLQAAKIPISDLKDEIIIIKSNSSDENNGDIDKLTATSTNTNYVIVLGIVSILITAIAVANAMLLDLDIQFTNTVDSTTSTSTNIWTQVTTNPTIILDALSTINIRKGILYFASFYIMAEILAIPVFPLTASSGFLFGIIPGTLICLLCATTAASISFIIGRTLLREYVESILASNPKFQSFDRIIQRGGFKLMLLVRLSPIFPFAVSNYLYGASGIGFVPYFLGTVVGFMPGTFAYVYAGRVGKALTIDNNINIINSSNSAAASSMSTTTLSSTTEPWYIYVGGMVVVLVLLKIVGDVASGVIETLNDEDYDGDDNFLGGGGNIMR